MKKIILLANDKPGLDVCKYLVVQGEQIERLYIHEEQNAKYTDEIIKASNCERGKIYLSKDLKDPIHLNELKKVKTDWIITVYWAYLISEKLINMAREGTINFHPALLPINRGWYPHVHSIIDDTPTGVTLHVIEKTADTGPIWAQKEVPIEPLDTSDTIYYRLQEEIVKLFRETWPDIKSGKIKAIPQDEAKAIYHKKAEVDALDFLDLNAEIRVRDVINILRARSFGNRGFAYYENDGQRVYVNIRLSKSSHFGQE